MRSTELHCCWGQNRAYSTYLRQCQLLEGAGNSSDISAEFPQAKKVKTNGIGITLVVSTGVEEQDSGVLFCFLNNNTILTILQEMIFLSIYRKPVFPVANISNSDLFLPSCENLCEIEANETNWRSDY